jgi:hypothetical protein
LLAPIPFAGPVLGIVWILIALIVGGSERMKVSMKGAVVASFVTVSAMVALVVATWFIARYIPPYTSEKEPPLRRGRQ